MEFFDERAAFFYFDLFSDGMGRLAARKKKGPQPNPLVCFRRSFFLPSLLLLAFLPTRETEAPSPTPEEKQESPSEEPPEVWFYLDQERSQIGPLSLSKLKRLFYRGDLTGKSLVWTPTFNEWKKIEQLPDSWIN